MEFVRKILKSAQNSSDKTNVPDQAKTVTHKAVTSLSPEAAGRERRRSTRLLVTVPVTISGKNARGESFREETQTISINRQGASLATWQTITPGSEILVENPPRGLAVRGKVVSFSEKSAPTMPHQIGVELADSKNIWGIQYPPLDWRRAPAIAITKAVPSPVARAVPPVAAKPPQSEPVARKVSPPPAALEVDFSAAVKPEPAPTKLDSLSQQPEIDAEKLFKAAGLKLARLAGQIDARLQANANQLLTRLDEKEKTLSSLTTQLSGIAERAGSSHLELEALLSEAEEARRKAQHEFQEAGLSLQQASEQLISSVTQDLGKRLAEGLESTAGALMEQMRHLAADQIAAAVRDFRQEMQESLTGLAEDRLSSETAEVQALHSRTIEQTETRIGALLGSALERFGNDLNQAAQNFRQTALSSLASEWASQSALELEAKQGEALERVQTEVGLITRSAVENLRGQIEQVTAEFQETSLAGLSEQLSARAASELQAQQAGMVEQAKGEIQASARSVIESSQAQIEQSARKLEESVLPSLAEKITARAASELQARQAGMVEQAKGEIQASARSLIESSQAQIEQSARHLEESILPSLAEKITAQAASELQTQQAGMIEQAKGEIQASARSATESSQAQIEQSARKLEESVLPSLAEKITARAASELQAQQAGMVEQAKGEIQASARSVIESSQAQIEESARKLEESVLPSLAEKITSSAASELQARQAGMVEQAKGEIQASARSVIESSQAQIEQSARHLEESILPSLAEKITAQAASKLQAIEAETAEQTRNQISQLTQAGLAGFHGLLEQAANDASESALANFTNRSAAELEKQRLEATGQFQATLSLAANEEQEGFRAQIRSYLEEQQALADQIAQKPSHEIAKYAEDTLLMVREQISEIRKESVEGIRSQLSAITRGTLSSIAEEARATAEEYRKQLRETFDGLKQKSAADIESTVKEVLERGREAALHQLQKDAEDFSSVAVAQFRSKSEEAAREATEAVNKQVGAAAFVVKDWVDQATQRLDGQLAKMETTSERALQIIEVRSMDVSKIVMQRVEQESDALISDLRRRIQNAALALTQGFGGTEGVKPAPERPTEHEERSRAERVRE